MISWQAYYATYIPFKEIYDYGKPPLDNMFLAALHTISKINPCIRKGQAFLIFN